MQEIDSSSAWKSKVKIVKIVLTMMSNEASTKIVNLWLQGQKSAVQEGLLSIIVNILVYICIISPVLMNI